MQVIFSFRVGEYVACLIGESALEALEAAAATPTASALAAAAAAAAAGDSIEVPVIEPPKSGEVLRVMGRIMRKVQVTGDQFEVQVCADFSSQHHFAVVRVV